MKVTEKKTQKKKKWLIFIALVGLSIYAYGLTFSSNSGCSDSKPCRTAKPICTRTLSEQINWSNNIWEAEIIGSEYKAMDGICIYDVKLKNIHSGKLLKSDKITLAEKFPKSEVCSENLRGGYIAIMNLTEKTKYYHYCNNVVLVDLKNKDEVLRLLK